MSERRVITGRVVIVLSILFLVANCAGNSRRISGLAALSDLTDLAQLRQVFNDEQGRVRLVALLSPV